MTAEEKAKELIGKFYVNIPLRDCDNRRPHKLALIAVDEILNKVMMWWELPCKDPYFITQKTYWEEVKNEIEKL
jgi:hypothetical protein